MMCGITTLGGSRHLRRLVLVHASQRPSHSRVQSPFHLTGHVQAVQVLALNLQNSADHPCREVEMAVLLWH